jgi:hypothetical protein
MALVSGISLIIISMLAFNIAGNIRSLDNQAKAQVKQDYSQKEDAILNALIHIVPNKAIGAMQRYSANRPTFYNWSTIFQEALAMANAEKAISPQLLNSLNLSNAITANSGDSEFSAVTQFVGAPMASPAGGNSIVNGGNALERIMLGSARIGTKVPAALDLSYNDYLLDRQYPIISTTKTYTSSFPKGLGLSAAAYPAFNLIQYPDVKFGYKRPGENFVAKRNWWVFSLTFGSHNQAQTGLQPVTKDYVLSIYEVPSQIPLSADALMKVGQFEDGTAWKNVNLNGSIHAKDLETSGTVALTEGAISAQKSVNVSNRTSVQDKTVTSGFDAMGERESRLIPAANNGNNTSNFYEASTGGNVGKVAFIPINRGTQELIRTGDGTASERISPTGWHNYSQSAWKASMTLEIRSVSSWENQTPTSIRFSYRNASNEVVTVTYTRNSNWPTETQTGGSTFPFQTTTLDNTRKALIIHMDRLPAFINSRSNSGGMSRNHSLYVFCRSDFSAAAAVRQPSIPSLPTDTVLTLRGGANLTAFTSGFSLVSRYRVYIADSLNNTPTTIPANSGIPQGSLYYPPLSIFAPEKRFGESISAERPVELTGQLSSLKTGDGDTFNPLEIMSGADQRLNANNLHADLISLRSPAELPPIYLMNWLVTIEEIH